MSISGVQFGKGKGKIVPILDDVSDDLIRVLKSFFFNIVTHGFFLFSHQLVNWMKSERLIYKEKKCLANIYAFSVKLECSQVFLK